MPLSAEDIQKGFAALSAELERRGERGQIAIAGGAAMVLLFNARKTTKDVDAFVVAAWRDAIDRGDARLLLSTMRGTAEEIWARVEQYVPRPQIDKASYAFDDLWDSVYGTSPSR